MMAFQYQNLKGLAANIRPPNRILSRNNHHDWYRNPIPGNGLGKKPRVVRSRA
jgi:hypothetical protein